MSFILFTKGRSWWSKVICSVLQEPFSHVSRLQNGWVYHADLLGVRKERLSEFRKRQVMLVAVPVPYDYDLNSKYARYKHSMYDIGAGVFIGLSFLARRYAKVPLPKTNLWNTSGMFICTEFATEVLGDQDPMITPYGLYKQLAGKYGEE